MHIKYIGFGLFWFYGITTIVGYLKLKPFLYIQTVLFQTIQFSISILFKCQKQFFFKQFSLAYKISLFQTIQFSVIHSLVQFYP